MMKGLKASSLFIDMISKQKIKEVITPKINEMDAFLVDMGISVVMGAIAGAIMAVVMGRLSK